MAYQGELDVCLGSGLRPKWTERLIIDNCRFRLGRRAVRSVGVSVEQSLPDARPLSLARRAAGEPTSRSRVRAVFSHRPASPIPSWRSSRAPSWNSKLEPSTARSKASAGTLATRTERSGRGFLCRLASGGDAWPGVFRRTDVPSAKIAGWEMGRFW